VVASDSSSTVLADLIGSNSTSSLKGPTRLFDKGVARLADLIVEASFGITEPIELSLLADAVVAPAFVDVIFGAQCPPGDEESSTAQGNTVCQPCTRGYYANSAGSCKLCPNSADCNDASTVSDWKLHPGHWRMDDESTDVRKCRFGSTSCPGGDSNQAAGPNQNCTAGGAGQWPYCACGYIGPLCSECDEMYFVSWAGDSCEKCADSAQHAPSIWLGASVVVASFVGLAACAYRKKCKTKLSSDEQQEPETAPQRRCCRQRRIDLKTLARVSAGKLELIFVAAQVIGQFSSISINDGGRQYPQPASSLAGVLGVANFAVLDYFPTACASPRFDFYDKLLFMTVAPGAVALMFWMPAVWRVANRRDSHETTRTAVKYSLVWLELVLPSVSTVIAQVCDILPSRTSTAQVTANRDQCSACVLLYRR
jgi:hypothetical protein